MLASCPFLAAVGLLLAVTACLATAAGEGRERPTARLRIEPGHPWRPPFGLDRVGRPPDAVVEINAGQRPAGEHVLVGYRQGNEVCRHVLTLMGEKPPYVARAPLDAWPSEVVLFARAAPADEPVELARQPVSAPAFEAEAVARPDRVLHPVDLGTILVPGDWLLLAGGQKAEVDVAALSRSRDVPARVAAWYESAPAGKVAAELPLAQGRKAQRSLSLPACSTTLERDVLHVAIAGPDGTELWRKATPVMIVPKPPQWPAFGAVRTKLRYDAPILAVVDGKRTSLDYGQAWAPQLHDVVVFLPNGARYVFWRGSSYIPFWASRFNTGLCYEWAERVSHREGFRDCPEPLMDKELRYGRVEIVESTATRVHVRWSYQSCDFDYRVNGDLATEDYYFYPDGFGTRVLTLTSIPEAQYELAEFIILTPQATFPLDVLPPDLIDILPLAGEKAVLRFPFSMKEQGREWEKGARLPAVYRVRLNRHEPLAAVSFCPLLKRTPGHVFEAFRDQGLVVTPAYWGNHWPLARGCPTNWSGISDQVGLSPAHNSLMTWVTNQPEPIRSQTVETRDALGQLKAMKVRTWVWLIGMADASDDALLAQARSFAQPPSLDLQGARPDAEAHAPERRALRLVVERPDVAITIKPEGRCVNPVFELRGAPKTLLSVKLADQALDRTHYAWDGSSLWLRADLSRPTSLRLEFGGEAGRAR